MFFLSPRWTEALSRFCALAILTGGLSLVSCAKEDSKNSSGGVTASTGCALSAEWKTSDDFFTSDTKKAELRGVAQDSSGSFYAVGVGESGSPTSSQHWLVRKSADASSGSWAPVDDYQLSSGKNAVAKGIEIDSSGNVYVVGSAADASNVLHWIVRKADTKGVWTTVDDYQLDTSKDAEAAKIAKDSSGNLYVVGYAKDTAGVKQWVLRKSATGASGSWTATGDTALFESGQISEAFDIDIDSTGAAFIAGRIDKSTTGQHWAVLKLASGASVFTSVDDFQISEKNAGASAINVSKAGAYYAAGFAFDETGAKEQWVVRKSTDSGATWATVDTFVYLGGVKSNPLSIGFDKTDAVYVAGRGYESNNTQHMIVRRSTDSGATFSTYRDVQYYLGKDAVAFDFLNSKSGSLYSGGSGYDKDGFQHWFLQSRACE